MLTIGLTGSIAMGKSSAASYLVQKGLPVWSADEAVHELYRGEAALLIESVFPGTTNECGVDRARLSEYLMKFPRALSELEAIIHPLVEKEREAFVKSHRDKGAKCIVLDIPLLFEKQYENHVDVTLLLTAPPDIQRQRVLTRTDMTPEKFEMFLSHQMSDEEKRQRADFIVDTSGSFSQTHVQLDQFLEAVQKYEKREDQS
jgi:dephospho-CoA kinase